MSEQVADHVWYFARGDEERGPFSEPQMRSLVVAGKLQEEDLVWKEGMPDWVLARDAPGLMAPAPPAEPPIIDPQPPGEETGESPPTPTPTTRHAPVQVHEATGARQLVRALGFLFAAIGFMAIVGARGCESLSARYAERLSAVSELNAKQFKAAWEDQRDRLREEQKKLMQGSMTPTDGHRAQQIETELGQLDQRQQAQQAVLEATDWRKDRRAAEQAQYHNQLWGVARQLTFFAGVLIFTVGLFLTGFVGEAAERWVSLLVIGAVVFSLLLGGAS